jgi:hypothetical protein
MFSHFYFVLWLSHQLSFFHLPVAGHEMTCAADRQGSAMSSSLIQSASHTLRSSVSMPSSSEATADSQEEKLSKIVDEQQHATPQASSANKTITGQDLQHQKRADNKKSFSTTYAESSSAGAREKLDSGQQVKHKLLSLIQHQSGSIGAVMFITAVFFLLGVCMMLAVALSPAYKHDDDESPTSSKRYMESPANMSGSKAGTMHYVSNTPQAQQSQYSSTRADARRNGPSLTPSPSQPAPAVTAGDVKPKALSPQLVVPDDCECALVLKNPSSTWRGSFDVCDTRGSPVLQVSIQDTIVSTQQALEIQLCSSAAPGQVVARCRVLKASKNPTFCVYQKETSEVFATVTSEIAGRARLVLAAGGYFDFLSDDPANVRAVDEHGQLHGTSESYAPSRESGALPSMFTDETNMSLVRVGPLSDAGLVLCGLMCLHQLNLAK